MENFLSFSRLPGKILLHLLTNFFIFQPCTKVQLRKRFDLDVVDTL